MKTHKNQKVVKVAKEPVSEDFLQIHNPYWMHTFRELPHSAFGLYLYLVSNKDGYVFALSPADIVGKQQLMSLNSYHRAVKVLTDKGYLIPEKGNFYRISVKPPSFDTPTKGTSHEGDIPKMGRVVSPRRGDGYTHNGDIVPPTVGRQIDNFIDINIERKRVDPSVNVSPSIPADLQEYVIQVFGKSRIHQLNKLISMGREPEWIRAAIDVFVKEGKDPAKGMGLLINAKDLHERVDEYLENPHLYDRAQPSENHVCHDSPGSTPGLPASEDPGFKWWEDRPLPAPPPPPDLSMSEARLTPKQDSRFTAEELNAMVLKAIRAADSLDRYVASIYLKTILHESTDEGLEMTARIAKDLGYKRSQHELVELSRLFPNQTPLRHPPL